MTAGNSAAHRRRFRPVLSLGVGQRARPRAAGLLADAETAAVDYVHGNEGLLMAPAYAVPRMLERNGLNLQDFDFYEIHEAFRLAGASPRSRPGRTRSSAGASGSDSTPRSARSTARSSTSTGPRSPRAARSPRPAAGSSTPPPSCSPRRAQAGR